MEWREMLLEHALRYDTSMADAMLKALGAARKRRPGRVEYDRFRDVRECFENRKRVRL